MLPQLVAKDLQWFVVCFIRSVKDGIFRKYPSTDAVEPVMSFLNNEKWQQLTPLPWYYAPSSLP